jgi:hypothetical protein
LNPGACYDPTSRRRRAGYPGRRRTHRNPVTTVTAQLTRHRKRGQEAAGSMPPHTQPEAGSGQAKPRPGPGSSRSVTMTVTQSLTGKLSRLETLDHDGIVMISVPRTCTVSLGNNKSLGTVNLNLARSRLEHCVTLLVVTRRY